MAVVTAGPALADSCGFSCGGLGNGTGGGNAANIDNGNHTSKLGNGGGGI